MLPAVILAGAGLPALAATGSPDPEPVANLLTLPRWSPYVAGVGIGVLTILTFVLSDKPFGASTAFARTAGMLERLARGKKVEEKAYYREYEPKVDYEWMLVAGLFVGAAAAAWLGGSFAWKVVPARWAGALGTSPLPRLAVAVLGGTLIGFGARWGCGCTSGHGISGTLQLALSSWLAVVLFFLGGILSAHLIYHVLAP
jgi:hypothetical protein